MTHSNQGWEFVNPDLAEFCRYLVFSDRSQPMPQVVVIAPVENVEDNQICIYIDHVDEIQEPYSFFLCAKKCNILEQ